MQVGVIDGTIQFRGGSRRATRRDHRGFFRGRYVGEESNKEPLIRATQWEGGASFSLSTRGPEFWSGTAPTPVSLSNRFTVLDERCAEFEVHPMTDAESVDSTESDTISLAGEPRIRRRRLSLVWDNTHENPHARQESEVLVQCRFGCRAGARGGGEG